jgi:hypothetical protein
MRAASSLPRVVERHRAERPHPRSRSESVGATSLIQPIGATRLHLTAAPNVHRSRIERRQPRSRSGGVGRRASKNRRAPSAFTILRRWASSIKESKGAIRVHDLRRWAPSIKESKGSIRVHDLRRWASSIKEPSGASRGRGVEAVGVERQKSERRQPRSRSGGGGLAATKKEMSSFAAHLFRSGGGGNRTHVPMPVHECFYVRSRSFKFRPARPRSTGFQKR